MQLQCDKIVVVVGNISSYKRAMNVSLTITKLTGESKAHSTGQGFFPLRPN